MTTEEIIQRLLDEKHITVAEAVQMIKDLVKNEIFTFPIIIIQRKHLIIHQQQLSCME